MPLHHISNAIVKFCPFRNGLKGRFDQFDGIVFHKSQRIERRHEHTAVPAIAAVHDVTHPVGNFGGLVYHSGRHQTNKIGFNLKIQIVGVRIVFPETRGRRHDPVQDVVTRGLIGVGEVISSVGPVFGYFFLRNVQTVIFECSNEVQIGVHVVEKPGFLVPPVFHVAFAPWDVLLIRDQRTLVLKFHRRAIHHADGLTSPASFYFVLEIFLCKNKHF